MKTKVNLLGLIVGLALTVCGCTTLPPKPEDQGVLRKESETQSLRSEEEKKSDSSLWPVIIDICIGISRIL